MTTPPRHYLRVRSYIEMRQKMLEVSRDVSLHRELLEYQRGLITLELMKGERFASVVGV